jgi:hypothetical protein
MEDAQYGARHLIARLDEAWHYRHHQRTCRPLLLLIMASVSSGNLMQLNMGDGTCTETQHCAMQLIATQPYSLASAHQHCGAFYLSEHVCFAFSASGTPAVPCCS